MKIPKQKSDQIASDNSQKRKSALDSVKKTTDFNKFLVDFQFSLRPKQGKLVKKKIQKKKKNR